MAFIRLVMLLGLLVLLLWMTSSAHSQSHDLSLTNRVRRDQPFETRQRVQGTFEVVKDGLSALTAVSETLQWRESVKDHLKKLAKFASLAPSCIGVIFSLVNAVLVFIPQDDPVLTAVKEGFAEVNRKLDSISIQITNLAADVEWFNYASVYAQDEMRILNAWRKLTDLRENSKLAQTQEEKMRLSEIFINYYEYTQTEASVANLHHYLTVSSTSLSRNLNELLRTKFKCDIREIMKYNQFFNSLLLYGAVMNEVYWELIGLKPSNKEDYHSKMFNDIYTAQIAAVDYCLNNYEKYMTDDVVETTKKNSPNNKQAIADQVKMELDGKYDWYKWVVVVYDTDQEGNFQVSEMTKIPVGAVTVAVSPILKADEVYGDRINTALDRCFEDQNCGIQSRLSSCRFSLPSSPQRPGSSSRALSDYVKATHVSYGSAHVERPNPLKLMTCRKRGYEYKISIHSSIRMAACTTQTCLNNGHCKRLLHSNDMLCECQSGYYGNVCEHKIDISDIKKAVIPYALVPVISSSTRMKLIESKLEQVIRTINIRCG